jgi:hypothetical protein
MRQKSKKKGSWSRKSSEVLLLCASVALIYWVFAPDTETVFKPVSIADLKGVWTTTHLQYQDRFLQFDEKAITFGWGADGMGAYTMDNIDSDPGEDGTLVRVRYHDLAETDYQFHFFHVDQNGGRIRMKNQKGIYWFRILDQPIHPHEFK